MSVGDTAPLSDTVISTYETLRNRILVAPSRSVGELGLIVLLRQGMLTWARTHALVLREFRPGPSNVDATRVSAPLHDELIHVMAAMSSNVFRATERGALAI